MTTKDRLEGWVPHARLIWSRGRRLRSSGGDRGFTLVELAMTTMIAGIFMALALWGMRGYLNASNESATTQDIVASLRNVAQQAQSEGRTYCVAFKNNGRTWSVWRYSCQATYVVNGFTPRQTQGSLSTKGSSLFGTVSFAAGVNAGSCPYSQPAGGCVYFYPRGNASGGTLQVTRPGSSTTYTVTVDGMTGRVSSNH
jgi:prepilin-type N-terminal cleavage/methylation domain-containing protein